MKPQSLIRNFVIIAHIDHGKSTLADRFLELTGTISAREHQEQFLDSMELEREKGVTIKASAVTLLYQAADGQEYQLNLIDTPGHVDFAYEVSRALTACEGAILVVDATQGVEAQTLANLYLALEHDLEIIPVVNKIDLPVARPEEVKEELHDLLGLEPAEILEASAKEGTHVEDILEAVVQRTPPPKGQPEAPLRALIFDSHYDPYKGVIAYVRVVDGHLPGGQTLKLFSNGVRFEPLEVGLFRPAMIRTEALGAGQVGYVATGLKDVRDCSVGDTITQAASPASGPLPGYRPAKPMVFAGLYPMQSDNFPLLRDALEKLKLNDASLAYEPEESGALGFGYRCGFLGLFHLEIVQERLEREYELELLATAPSVAYRVLLTSGQEVEIDSPAELPDLAQVREIREPWMRISIFIPDDYIGPVMELVTRRRGVYGRMEYLSAKRVLLEYEMPLSEMLTEFYDQLKSATKGYASLDYQFAEYRPGDVVRLQILVNGVPVDALSVIVGRDEAQQRGRTLVERLKDLIPRHQFPVPVQAAIGGKIIARETVKALRKNVLAKCYGGDVTRKRKLLERQKEGKKRLKRFGDVEIPQEAFLAVLKLGE